MNELEKDYLITIVSTSVGLAAVTFAYYQTTLEHWIIAGFSGALLMGFLTDTVDLLNERM